MNQFAHFPANYTIHLDQELPGSGGEIPSFTRDRSGRVPSGIDGPLLGIEPVTGPRWLAYFANGWRTNDLVDAVFTTPDPDAVCVVAKGAGYWLNVKTREKKNIPVFPIRQVEVAGNRVLFADFTRLASFCSVGLEWVSERLTSDKLKISEVDTAREVAVCNGWDAPSCRETEFSVDLRTGHRI
jgi:hypothetical protein